MLPEGYVFYHMTCTTPGCAGNGITYRGPGPEETTFACGSCGNSITNWELSPDQSTKDGCIAFCPDSASHNSWAECVNAALARTNN